MCTSPLSDELDLEFRAQLDAGRARNLASLKSLHAGLLAARDELSVLTGRIGCRLEAPFRPDYLHVTINRWAGPEVAHEVVDAASEVLSWCDDNCARSVRLDWTLNLLGYLVPMFRCGDRDDAEALAEHWNGDIWN